MIAKTFQAPLELVAEPQTSEAALTGALQPLLFGRAATLNTNPLPEAVIGVLVAIADNGDTPLITYAGQPGTSALPARSVMDLHGAHIGRNVLLSFENGNGALPIVTGVLRQGGSQVMQSAGQVQVDADGERMIVSAKEQLVLQCGKASITLTSAGKILINGDYVSTQSTGVNRVKGASVQIN